MMEKKKKTIKIQRKRKTKIKKMTGGKEEAISWDSGGTGITDLPNDIIGVIVHTINTVLNALNVIQQISGLQSNMGTAFTSKADPSPDSVDVSSM